MTKRFFARRSTGVPAFSIAICFVRYDHVAFPATAVGDYLRTRNGAARASTSRQPLLNVFNRIPLADRNRDEVGVRKVPEVLKPSKRPCFYTNLGLFSHRFILGYGLQVVSY